MSRGRPYPVAEARRCADLLRAWSQQRIRASDLADEELHALMHVADQCETFRRLLRRSGAEVMRAPILSGWLRLVTETLPSVRMPRRPGSAPSNGPMRS